MRVNTGDVDILYNEGLPVPSFCAPLAVHCSGGFQIPWSHSYRRIGYLSVNPVLHSASYIDESILLRDIKLRILEVQLTTVTESAESKVYKI